MSELFVDYQLRFNFRSESMTTFPQSSWIPGTKYEKYKIKSKKREESQTLYPSSIFFVNILFAGAAVCYQTVPHT